MASSSSSKNGIEGWRVAKCTCSCKLCVYLLLLLVYGVIIIWNKGNKIIFFRGWNFIFFSDFLSPGVRGMGWRGWLLYVKKNARNFLLLSLSLTYFSLIFLISLSLFSTPYHIFSRNISKDGKSSSFWCGGDGMRKFCEWEKHKSSNNSTAEKKRKFFLSPI